MRAGRAHGLTHVKHRRESARIRAAAAVVAPAPDSGPAAE